MFRNLSLSLLTIIAFALSRNSFAVTYVDNGTNTNYSLNAGDSLFIASGTYTGAITGASSATIKITVSDLATFQPSSINNNFVATMNVYGTVIFNYNIRTNTNFTLNNFGIFTVTGNTVIVGNNQVWTNHIGGIMNFGNVTMNGQVGDLNNVMYNYETVNCTGTFQMNSGSAFYNTKDFDITGTFRVNGGTFDNTGKMDVTGNILMNNGASIIRNYCGMTATGGIDNTSGNFYNYSFLWAINSDLLNSANIINAVYSHSTPMIQARNFLLSSGTISGPCLMYFTGTTTHTGGVIGVAGITSDTIKVYDVTRTQPTQIFDVQSGGVRHPNVIYNAWGTPDTSFQWYWGCSYEYLLDVPLAIAWNYFYVDLINDVPVLNWSATGDRGTVFEIQRSYDARNYTAIAITPYQTGRSAYTYPDDRVNRNANYAYYRIRAIEPGGEEKFTQAKMVKFTSRPGDIHILPNPFTHDIFINYTAKEEENLVIRVFSSTGQQMLMKRFPVNKGNNNIRINEVVSLAKGIYIIQVNSGNRLLSSEKIIRQ